MAGDDITQIIQVINLYGYAMDSQSWDLFDRIFLPDASVVFTDTDESRWTDLAAFKRDFEACHTTLDATRHALSGHVVAVDGDSASAFTHGSWQLIKRGTLGGDIWEGNGWYDDQLVRTPDGWRIKSRICRTIWWGGNVRVIETVPGIRFDLPVDSVRAIREAGECGLRKALDR